MSEPVHIISLGAGVQSSTMALMAAKGELPDSDKVIGAIFADTQAEPKSVYDWLDWLEKQLPFPVYRVTAGSLESKTQEVHVSRKSGKRYTRHNIPVYVKNNDGTGGIKSRACTFDFKITPILKKAKQLGKVGRGEKRIKVIQWIGISLDEIRRMKPSQQPWAKNVWPLIDAKMSRHDCILWMEKNGYKKPPRSACVFCPFHGHAEWRRLKEQEPEEFNRAVQFERNYQAVFQSIDRISGIPFLHQSCIPLDQIDFTTDIDRGQGELNLFNNECEGMCGV